MCRICFVLGSLLLGLCDEFRALDLLHGQKLHSRSNNKNKENDAKRRCCSGSFCTRASDPLLSDNKCPVCMMAVHPLCEVWSSPHQEHICCMCDAGMGEELFFDQNNPH